MASSKKQRIAQSFISSIPSAAGGWQYIRLSKEDLKKGKDDSNSVINQRDSLNDFTRSHRRI